MLLFAATIRQCSDCCWELLNCAVETEGKYICNACGSLFIQIQFDLNLYGKQRKHMQKYFGRNKVIESVSPECKCV